MMDILTRMWPKKKTKNSATIAGAVSLAALSGALITWYSTRKRNRRENEFLYSQEEENQP